MHVNAYTYDVESSCLYLHAPAAALYHALLLQLDVTVRYENETYTVEEEAGVVTLALVLEGEAVIPVTVSVNTLDLLDDSVGDDATGELYEFQLLPLSF